MLQRSTIRSRFGLAGAALIALLVLSTGAVSADTGPIGGTFTQNGKSADAGSGDCVSNGDGTVTCSGLGISVFLGKMSDSVSGVTHANQACAYTDRFTYSEATGEIVGEYISEYGCEVDLPSGQLAFGRNLSTATLKTTTVTLERWDCDELACELVSTRDVAVAGTWTGIGPTMTSKWRSTFDDGTCRYADAGKGSSREASFTGSIGGASLGPDTFASIRDGKSTFRSRCIEI